jgi:hypothetical protein
LSVSAKCPRTTKALGDTWPSVGLALKRSDHIDARQTIGLIISPYAKRKALDSTLYTTSSMLLTIELLLGLPPMTQYDAAATPMYASFTQKADLTPFDHAKPVIDINQVNSERGWGSRRESEDGFSRVRPDADVRAKRDRMEKRRGRRLGDASARSSFSLPKSKPQKKMQILSDP